MNPDNKKLVRDSRLHVCNKKRQAQTFRLAKSVHDATNIHIRQITDLLLARRIPRNLPGVNVDFKANQRASYPSASTSASQASPLASLGIRQSPRGESATEPTFGPSGMAERLNCCEKKRW